MSCIIGSARGDEHGHITGGQAGDQTGREVCTEAWYNSSKGWRVFRAIEPDKAEKLAECMLKACANNKIGYDQSNNQSLWNAVQSVGYDPSKVTAPVETDCSQLVRVCCNYAGIPVGMFSTADEPKYLLGTGQFKELTESAYTSKSSYLQKGDVLCTRSKGHTCIVVADGDKVGTFDGQTVKWSQRKLGTPVDGEVWKQYRPNKKYVPTATDAWKWKLLGTKGGSAMIKAMQTRVGETGKAVDGIFGKNTSTKLQTYLQKQGHVIASEEITKHISGKTTVRAWQHYISV